ncbi:hypothetical protein MANES_09G134100v8 [Manihot esculenta]|uniref:Uncharacterized protein n=1 Tax=Manihot esculenta TaxID=3983 RepID=A0ACB7H5I4_MANES|nr:hypothetical protein MANES_09G134100v8 [Manihot esculenta]
MHKGRRRRRAGEGRKTEMSGGESEEEYSLEFTPTWVVAAVCTVIVAVSLALERFLHYSGKYFKRKKQKPLYEALQKIKEELMLLGFISLLLTVSQGTISKFCVPERVINNMLPCDLSEKREEGQESNTTATTASISGTTRHLLAETVESQIDYCQKKIRQWQHWENSIGKDRYDTDEVLRKKVTSVYQHKFIQEHFAGIFKDLALLGWITHCRGNPKFNFHRYMVRALEDDFKTVVGTSWYLWIFVVIFLLLNVNGWHTYFWIAFIPFLLLFAVGTKLEHVITELAREVAEKHIAIEGDLVVKPSDEHFWFNRPDIILYLIHFVLFQNAFEIAVFFWIWVLYGFDSCIMGKVRYIVPRMVIGVFIQIFCSYSTLPLYAIVTQMGSSYKKVIFDEHIQAGIIDWAEKVKKKRGLKEAAAAAASSSSRNGSSQTNYHEGSSSGIQIGRAERNGSTTQEIQPSADREGQT